MRSDEFIDLYKQLEDELEVKLSLIHIWLRKGQHQRGDGRRP